MSEDRPRTLDELLDLIERQRGISREQARAALAAMPGGGELLTGMPLERSTLPDELAEGDLG